MAGRDLVRRLERLEAAERVAGVRVEVVRNEAHAARVKLDHLAVGDPRSLILVRTGVPRDPEEP